MKQGSKRNRDGFENSLEIGCRAIGESFVLNETPDCRGDIHDVELIKTINIIALSKISNFI